MGAGSAERTRGASELLLEERNAFFRSEKKKKEREGEKRPPRAPRGGRTCPGLLRHGGERSAHERGEKARNSSLRLMPEFAEAVY